MVKYNRREREKQIESGKQACARMCVCVYAREKDTWTLNPLYVITHFCMKWVQLNYIILHFMAVIYMLLFIGRGGGGALSPLLLSSLGVSHKCCLYVPVCASLIRASCWCIHDFYSIFFAWVAFTPAYHRPLMITYGLVWHMWIKSARKIGEHKANISESQGKLCFIHRLMEPNVP